MSGKFASQRVEKLQGECENWREIGQKDNPDFENGWANVGGTHAVAAFYKDKFNIVHLKGTIDSGTSGNTAFTLPADYSPDEQFFFNALQSSGAAGSYVLINTDGTVSPTRTGATVYLNDLSWRV